MGDFYRRLDYVDMYGEGIHTSYGTRRSGAAAEQNLPRLRLDDRQPYSVRVQCCLDDLLQPTARRFGYIGVTGTGGRTNR